MDKSPGAAQRIEIGQPIPFDVYDARGNLLLKRGCVIVSANQLGRVIDEGVNKRDSELNGEPDDGRYHPGAKRRHTDYRVPHKGKNISVFDMITAAREATGELIANPLDYADFGAAVKGVCAEINRACELDADVALASILVDRTGAYSPRHAVNCVVVSRLILAAQENALTDRDALMGAALTMNISMAALQDALNSQDTPLSAAQLHAVKNHPRASSGRLRELGVSDPAWLAIVEQHHESVDGSGTPRGLKGDEICDGARILALADRYCAAVTGRAYRAGLVPQVVLAEIFTKEGRGVSQGLVKLLVREVGIYPPGSVVQLANGDTAVVVKRMPHANQPVVRSLVNRDGTRLAMPLKRLTSDATFAVKRALAIEELKVPLDPAKLWLETFELADVAAPAA